LCIQKHLFGGKFLSRDAMLVFNQLIGRSKSTGSTILVSAHADSTSTAVFASVPIAKLAIECIGSIAMFF
jgi:hypothetical protein